MSFWGVEVKPGKPYICSANISQRIYIRQATLGPGSSTKKSILQCNVADKCPIYLCTLLPEKIECFQLYLDLEDDNEITFSVIGPRSIHLSGFSVNKDREIDGDPDSFEDIEETESEESTDYGSEDPWDSFIVDDDSEEYPCSPASKSGVVIEEILEDEMSKYENDESIRTGAEPIDSEDEDGLPISVEKSNVDDTQKIDIQDEGDGLKLGKRKMGDAVPKPEHKSKSNKKAKKKNAKKRNEMLKDGEQSNVSEENGRNVESGNDVISDNLHVGDATDNVNTTTIGEGHEVRRKKKKKKKKNKIMVTGTDGDNGVDQSGEGKKVDNVVLVGKNEGKSLQVRTFGNGMVVEELVMGKPDGKRASMGKKVSVYYIGKLKKTGTIFDSNIGNAPFKFRLGVNSVIKGWDVGVTGMRIGDKRRLTIPPSMGYGHKRVDLIPENSWLVFDVELVDVQ